MTGIGQNTGNTDYAVGYGKPPAQTRWAKGTSGNPKERKKGSQNHKAVFLKVAHRQIAVTDINGKKVLKPMWQLVLEALFTHGAKGNSAMSKLANRLWEQYFREPEPVDDMWKMRGKVTIEYGRAYVYQAYPVPTEAEIKEFEYLKEAFSKPWPDSLDDSEDDDPDIVPFEVLDDPACAQERRP